MKRIKNWALTLGLAGSLLLGVASPQAAIALSEQEILTRLQSVPLFTLMDDKSNIVPAVIKDNQGTEKNLLVFFLNHQDALQALEQYKKSLPAEAQKAKVQPLSMADYISTSKKFKDRTDTLFTVEANNAYVQSALSILKADGTLVEKDGKLVVASTGKPYVLNDIPLFFAEGLSKDNKRGLFEISYERTVEGKKQVGSFVPFYLSKTDLDKIVAKSPPDSKIEIKVLMLSNFISNLEKAKTPKDAPYVIMPAQESIQYVESIRQTASQNQKSAPQKN